MTKIPKPHKMYSSPKWAAFRELMRQLEDLNHRAGAARWHCQDVADTPAKTEFEKLKKSEARAAAWAELCKLEDRLRDLKRDINFLLTK